MANQPPPGQDGLPAHQVPGHSFSQTFQSRTPLWSTHNMGFMPLFQQIPGIPSPPVQGHALLGQPVFRSVPPLSYPPARNPPPSYPSSGHSLYIPPPTENAEAKSRPIQYSHKGSLFVPGAAAEPIEASERAAQYDGDLALRHAAAKAAKNGIILEAPPSFVGSVSGAETQQSFSSQGYYRSLSQSSGAKARPFYSQQKAKGSSSHPQQPSLASTGSGYPTDSGTSVMTGCATSVPEAGLHASSLAKIFPMAMCSGLYQEHFSPSSSTQNTTQAVKSPGAVVEVSPFGRIKRPVDIKPPEMKDSTSAKCLNPSVAEFTPKPGPKLIFSSPDVDSCPDVFSGSKPAESTTTALKVDASQRNSAGLNSNNNSPTSHPASATPADKTESATDTTVKTSKASVGWSTWKREEWAEDWADKRHKSCQTECPVLGERKKMTDHASPSRKVLDLQAEVCRLRAQFCLNELQRERFHVELDMFWWKSNFQPMVPSHVSRTVVLAQTQLQNLMIQMRQIELQRDHYLSILKSGRELQEVPNFTVTLNSGETVTPINATGKAVVPFGFSPTPSTPLSKASTLPPITSAAPTSDAPTSDEASSRKKQRLEEPPKEVACASEKSAIPLEAEDNRAGLQIGKPKTPSSPSAISSISSSVEAMSLAEGKAAFSPDQGVTAVSETSCAYGTSGMTAGDLSENLGSEAVSETSCASGTSGMTAGDLSENLGSEAVLETSCASGTSGMTAGDLSEDLGSEVVLDALPVTPAPEVTSALSATAVFSSDTTASSTVCASAPSSATSASDMISATVCAVLSSSDTSFSMIYTSAMSSDDATSTTVCASTLFSIKTTSTAVCSSTLSSDKTTSTAVCSSTLSSDKTTSTAVCSPTLSSDKTTSTAVCSSTLSSDKTTSTAVCSSTLSSDKTTSTAVCSSTLSSDKTTSTAVCSSTLSSDKTTTTAVCSSTPSSDKTTSTAVGASHLSFIDVTASALPHLIISANETADTGPDIESSEVAIRVDPQQQEPAEDSVGIKEKPHDSEAQEVSLNIDKHNRTEVEGITLEGSEVFLDTHDLLSEPDDSGGKDTSSNLASDVSFSKDIEQESCSSPDKQISSQAATASVDKAASSNLSPSEAPNEGYSSLASGSVDTHLSRGGTDCHLSSEGDRSRACGGSVSTAGSTDPLQEADHKTVATDTGSCRTASCGQEPESSPAICENEILSVVEKAEKTTDATMLSARKNDDRTFEETAEVLLTDGSDAQLDELREMHSAEAGLQAKETDMFAVESDSDDEPPAPQCKEHLLMESAAIADDSIKCMDPETAEASLHKDTVQSTASPETVAEASTTLPFQQEEDGPVMEPPLEEAAREERKVEGGAGGGGRMETDPEQVLQSVTEKLKELYPKEAMDARWLQKTAEEQTRLFLQQLDVLAEETLSSSDVNTPALVKEPPQLVPDSTGAVQLSVEQTKDLQPTLQPVVQESVQQPFDGQRQDAFVQKQELLQQEREVSVGEREDLLARREEFLAQHKELMTQQNQTLARAAAIQQALLSLNQRSLAAPGDAELAAEIESKLKQYQSLLDNAETLGRKVSNLDQQLRSIQMGLQHQQRPSAPPSLPLHPPAAPRPPFSGSTSTFMSIHAAYPHFFRPKTPSTFQSTSVIPTGRLATAFSVSAAPGSLFGSSAFNPSMIPVPGNCVPCTSSAYQISASLAHVLPGKEAQPPCNLSLSASTPSLSVSRASAFKLISQRSTVEGAAASTPGMTPGFTAVSRSSVTCRAFVESQHSSSSDGQNCGLTTVPSTPVTFIVTASSAAQSKNDKTAANSQKSKRPFSPLEPTSSTNMTRPAASTSSSQAFKPLLPLKPIKVSNRYAALSSLSPCKSEQNSEKGPTVSQSLTAAFSAGKSSANLGGEGTDVGFQSNEEAFSSSERSIVLRDDLGVDGWGTKLEDQQIAEKDDWQMSTSRKHRGSISMKSRGEGKRGMTPPLTSRARNARRDKARCSRSHGSSSDSFSTKPDPTYTVPATVAGLQSSPTPENWDDECDPFPTLRGMKQARDNKLHFSGISPKTKPPPVPPGLMSRKEKPDCSSSSGCLSSKPPVQTKSGDPLWLQLADTSTSRAAAPQLDHFSFSKSLDKIGEASGQSRPNINKGFLGRLVRFNEASNLGRASPSGDAPKKNSLSKGWGSERGGAEEKAQSDTGVDEEWLMGEKKGKADSVTWMQPEEAVESTGEVAGATAAKGPTRLTCFKKLCLSIETSFPNLKREDIYRVIDEVKQSYGGHFHGKLFSGIMKDIQTVVLRDFSRSLRPTPQTMPKFTSMNTQSKEKKIVSEKKSEGIWQQPGQTGTSFKGHEDECSICLNEFLPGLSYPLECGHTFHKQCIDNWVKDQGERTCPICRSIVLMSEDFPRLGMDVPPSAGAAAPPVEAFSCRDEDFPRLGS